jgi:hypothetical protein
MLNSVVNPWIVGSPAASPTEANGRSHTSRAEPGWQFSATISLSGSAHSGRGVTTVPLCCAKAIGAAGAGAAADAGETICGAAGSIRPGTGSGVHSTSCVSSGMASAAGLSPDGSATSNARIRAIVDRARLVTSHPCEVGLVPSPDRVYEGNLMYRG